ncbi:MAG: hypothetical protein QM765_35840 [Myxococcales bacterium]
MLGSKLLQQLEVLRLHQHVLDEPGSQALLAGVGKLQHLKAAQIEAWSSTVTALDQALAPQVAAWKEIPPRPPYEE